ncbi:39182_t:CDS:2, partial [Gigaspora margarita]
NKLIQESLGKEITKKSILNLQQTSNTIPIEKIKDIQETSNQARIEKKTKPNSPDIFGSIWASANSKECLMRKAQNDLEYNFTLWNILPNSALVVSQQVREALLEQYNHVQHPIPNPYPESQIEPLATTSYDNLRLDYYSCKAYTTIEKFKNNNNSQQEQQKLTQNKDSTEQDDIKHETKDFLKNYFSKEGPNRDTPSKDWNDWYKPKSQIKSDWFDSLDSLIENKEWEEMLRDLSKNLAPGSSDISYTLIKTGSFKTQRFFRKQNQFHLNES